MTCVCGYTGTNSHVARHKQTCKQYAVHTFASQLEAVKDERDILRTRCEEYESELNLLRKQVDVLQGRLDEARKARPNQNVTINIVPYGQEAPLTNTQVRSILSSIPSESVSRYVELKHFGKPEHSNIRIPNKRGRTLQVVEEDKDGKRRRWVDKDRKEMLSAITDASLEELIDRFDAEKYKEWNDWFESSGLKDEGYDKTEAFKEIMKKVENVITSQNPSNEIA